MRMFTRILFLALLALAAFGCADDKKEPEKKPEAAPKAEAPAAAPATAPAALKVGFIYVSPIGDAGYSYAHDQGLV